MGDEPADNSISSRISGYLVLWLSSALEPCEREAVLGDLAESGQTGARAISDVLSLVLRRERAVWADWRLWLALVTLVLPLSFALSIVSHTTAGESAVYTWMYANNWDWALTANPGFWYVFGEVATRTLVNFLTLGCWSWSVGFALGRLPHELERAIRLQLLLLLALSQLASAPQRIIHVLMMFRVPPFPVAPDAHAPLTASTFYRVIFPIIVLALLVALPAMRGMRQGKQTALLNPTLRVILVIAVVIAISMMLLQVPGSGLILGASGWHWLWRHRDVLRILRMVAYWPALYLLALACRRYWHPERALV